MIFIREAFRITCHGVHKMLKSTSRALYALLIAVSLGFTLNLTGEQKNNSEIWEIFKASSKYKLMLNLSGPVHVLIERTDKSTAMWYFDESGRLEKMHFLSEGVDFYEEYLATNETETIRTYWKQNDKYFLSDEASFYVQKNKRDREILWTLKKIINTGEYWETREYNLNLSDFSFVVSQETGFRKRVEKSYYSAQGIKLNSIRSEIVSGENRKEKILEESKFTYLAFDEHGNWIKAIKTRISSSGSEKKDTIYREINYY